MKITVKVKYIADSVWYKNSCVLNIVSFNEHVFDISIYIHIYIFMSHRLYDISNCNFPVECAKAFFCS